MQFGLAGVARTSSGHSGGVAQPTIGRAVRRSGLSFHPLGDKFAARPLLDQIGANPGLVATRCDNAYPTRTWLAPLKPYCDQDRRENGEHDDDRDKGIPAHRWTFVLLHKNRLIPQKTAYLQNERARRPLPFLLSSAPGATATSPRALLQNCSGQLKSYLPMPRFALTIARTQRLITELRGSLSEG